MTIDLSPEEIEIIAGWYESAAGESAVDRSDETFALLERLGIEATESHLWLPNPDHVIDSHKPVVEAERAACMAYRERHPDMESVIAANRQTEWERTHK